MKGGADDNMSKASEEECVEEENAELRNEDKIRNKEEERRKARLRTRGPYRKSHADW